MLAVALLFVAYLQVSRTYPENSDESNDLLMAWDMLHGNVLLHGWYLSDVSFITTELPQYLMLERLFGLHTDTAHIAAAMTYTLVVVLAVLLARGRWPTARGARREAGPRMLLTAGLMFAPQLGVGVFVLLLSLGHIGTAVPLMLTWLVIDRASPGPGGPGWTPRRGASGGRPRVSRAGAGRRRAAADLGAGRRPAGARGGGHPAGGGVRDARRPRALPRPAAGRPGTRMGAGQPARALVRAVPGRGGHPRRRAWPRWSAGCCGPAAGFVLHPVPYQLAPVHTWPKHAWVTGEGLLALFGAKPQGPAAALAFALLHLAGVALVAWAMVRVARHFLSWPDMISQILLVAMVINVVVYVPSTLADATDLNAREFAVVLPFGAVLAGRTLAAGLPPAGAAAAGAGAGPRPCWPARCWPVTGPASATRRPSRPCPRPTRGSRRSWPRTT